jgi:two-component system, cell cycle response regulator
MLHVLLLDPLRPADVEELSRLLAASLEIPPGTPVESQVSGPGSEPPGAVPPLDLDRTVWVALSVRGAVGVLALQARDPQQFAAVTSKLVDGMTGPLALMLDNARLSQRLHEMSNLDGLTRLLNHRAIYERLNEEMERALRYDHALTVVLCDFDRFKQVNDTHGHLGGDAVLREGAAALRRSLRTGDLLGRYGGEEFLAVLPQVDLEAGRLAAERLRQSLDGEAIRLPGTPGLEEVRVTASFGVASLSELKARPSPDLLITLADRRLYEAKAAGRNRVRP